ncbi:MAG TPA: DUF1684 domain-containing protein [Candidatus Limnocylindria bacterium]|nr:DUF1684 domain-containing protein [Candidatus Limnocylindria bacterium]
MTDAEYARSIEEWRVKEQAALHGFPSVLAAIARHELPVGERVRVGPAGDIRLAEMDRTVVIEALRDGFLVDGEPSAPRAVDAGRYALRLSHQGYPAVVVLDRKARRRDAELRWYPVDPGLRAHGRLEPDGSPVEISSTASPARRAQRAGWFVFALDGATHRLAVTRLLEPGVPEGQLDAYFRDATTGRGSYEVGRYVTVERDEGGAVVDFNLAYNPACALSPCYNCPIPPQENRLAVAIRAGEMTPLVGPAPVHG